MHAQLNPGDILVIYSDGVTEANNLRYEEFEEQRLIDTLIEYRTESAANIVAAVTKALTHFAAGAPQADDITLVVAKRVA